MANPKPNQPPQQQPGQAPAEHQQVLQALGLQWGGWDLEKIISVLRALHDLSQSAPAHTQAQAAAGQGGLHDALESSLETSYLIAEELRGNP